MQLPGLKTFRKGAACGSRVREAHAPPLLKLKGDAWRRPYIMVGTRGIEPPASPTPKVRATPAPRPATHLNAIIL